MDLKGLFTSIPVDRHRYIFVNERGATYVTPDGIAQTYLANGDGQLVLIPGNDAVVSKLTAQANATADVVAKLLAMQSDVTAKLVPGSSDTLKQLTTLQASVTQLQADVAKIAGKAG
jgi:hypothetical protein